MFVHLVEEAEGLESGAGEVTRMSEPNAWDRPYRRGVTGTRTRPIARPTAAVVDLWALPGFARFRKGFAVSWGFDVTLVPDAGRDEHFPD